MRRYPDLDDRLDQFITRFVKDLENKLTTEKVTIVTRGFNFQIIRLDNGFHTTEREKHEWDAQKEKNDKNTEVFSFLHGWCLFISRMLCARCWSWRALRLAWLKREFLPNRRKEKPSRLVSLHYRFIQLLCSHLGLEAEEGAAVQPEEAARK